jgi:eukaryotic translation initiation factor 2C
LTNPIAVTAVYDFDFFLQAHGGLQGTTRPTHYYVVYDEIGFTADQMQTLTHEVSYLFARATKGVSLCSPAYYADIACERGRCYLHALLQGITSSRTTTVSSRSDREKEEAEIMAEAVNLWHGGVHKDLKVCYLSLSVSTDDTNHLFSRQCFIFECGDGVSLVESVFDGRLQDV